MKFQNTYRIETTRLANYDYHSNGYYFVTICTKDRKQHFGTISNHIHKLSQLGNIAQQYWNQISVLHKYVFTDAFIVMPNHIHGIIIIHSVETANLAVSNTPSLSLIVNQYKRACTLSMKKLNPKFEWQPRYYDHIIRNEKSYDAIRKYIYENPFHWDEDEENMHL